jgi:hypothetical protein
MTNFTFESIGVPAAEDTYTYIGVEGVDAAGDAVGTYGYSDGNGDSYNHGFIALSSAGIGETFDPPGSSNTESVGITAGGIIFGNYINEFNVQVGFVDNSGVVTQVNVPASWQSLLTTLDGVDAAGEIVGTFSAYDFDPFSVYPVSHGFIDNNGVYSQFDVAGATSTSISGISDAGEIFGNYTDANFVGHMFTFVNGVTTTIDVPGAYSEGIVGVSANGIVVGNFQDLSNNQHGFIENNGVVTQFDIAGATQTGINAISASGEIVGEYADSNGNIHGFIDNNGVITTVDVPGATETDIYGVNAAGDIFGFYNDATGQHGFVGDPAAAGPPSASRSTIAASTSGVTANGVATTTLTVTVEDANGNAVAGTAVTLSASGSGNIFGAISGTTDANGVFTTTLASTLAQSETITASEGSVQEQTSVTFVPGAVASTTSSIVSSLPTVMADGHSTTTLTVTVEDANGNAVAGTAVTLSASGSDNIFGSISGTTNANGVFTTTLASTLAQSETITATESGIQEQVSVNFSTVIQTDTSSFGTTELVQVGNHYYLDNTGTGTGVELQYVGNPVVAGQTGVWTPIGAVETASGYDVVWKMSGANEFMIWDTDSNGNYISSNNYAGNSTTLEALETTFHQDLNGDGVVGFPGTIQTDGTTSLVQTGNHYYLDSTTTGAGVELQYVGNPVVAGQTGIWTPIGAVQTTSGYDVAWKMTGANEFMIWNTDGNGNYISSTNYAGSSTTLEGLETTFHQDLNGDGVIGPVTTIAAGTTLEVAGASSQSIQFLGSTGTLTLDHASTFSGEIYDLTGNGSVAGSDQIDLRDVTFGAGTVESYSGNSSGGILTVSDSHNDVAHIALAGDYTGSMFTLSSDESGGTVVVDPPVNDIASGTLTFSDPELTGRPTATVSPQNGDAPYIGNFTVGAVDAAGGQEDLGWHFNFDPSDVSQPVTQTYDVAVADGHAGGSGSTATQAISVTIGGPGNDAFVFHPGLGTDVIANAVSSDTIDLDGFASVTSNSQLAELLHEAQIGQPQSLFQSINDGHDTLINLGNHDSITLANVHLADLHAGNFIVN